MAFTWVPDFLAALTLTPNVTEACRLAGITRKTAYDHYKRDADFAGAWDDAVEQSTDALVGEAYRRAIEGTTEPIIIKGKQVGETRKYDTTLLIFLLKCHRREVYGDKQALTHDGEVKIRVEWDDIAPAAEAPPGTDGDPGEFRPL